MRLLDQAFKTPSESFEISPLHVVTVVADGLGWLVFGMTGRTLERIAVVSRYMRELVELVRLGRDLIHRAVTAHAGLAVGTTRRQINAVTCCTRSLVTAHRLEMMFRHRNTGKRSSLSRGSRHQKRRRHHRDLQHFLFSKSSVA